MRPISDEEVRKIIADTANAVSPSLLDQAVVLAKGRPRRGFEALTLGENSALTGLSKWLAAPDGYPAAAHLELANAIQSDSSGSQASFARDVIVDWLAEEARKAAIGGLSGGMRLASASELWEKAHAQFAEADSLNLDQRQTLVSIFDAIREHVQKTRSASAEPS
jgi:DNA polymerase-3 subunit delta'